MAAGLAHALVYSNSILPAIGASGAISGVLAAFLVLFPRATIQTLYYGQIFKVHIWFYVFSWVLWNFVAAIQSLAPVSGRRGVDWLAHFAGFFFGMAFTHLIRIRKP